METQNKLIEFKKKLISNKDKIIFYKQEEMMIYKYLPLGAFIISLLKTLFLQHNKN